MIMTLWPRWDMRGPFWRGAFSVVNIHLMRAPTALRCRCHAPISVVRRLGSSILRSGHWPRRTPISISTMLSKLALAV